MQHAEWRTVPIRELYEGLYDGPHATPKPSSAGPVFLGIKNVTEDGRLDLTEIRHIDEEDYPTWTRRVEPRPGDLVFTYEATLNRYAIIPEGFRGCLGRRMALIRPDPKKVDVRFLLYYFFTRGWRSVIQNNVLTGATVDRIPLTNFPEFPVSAPPLCVQRQIAETLSAYDELIENNQRRIRILEKMARALYREWFVEFRFPGYENVEFVESSLGDIPKGWEIRTFAALASYINGYAFKPDDWGTEGKPIVKIRELKAGVTADTPRNSGDGLPDKFTVRDGDVLFSWSADLDAYIWIGGEALLNQHLFNVVPVEGVSRAFCFHALKEAMPRFRALSLGATMHHIKRSALDQVATTQPPRELLERFNLLVEPMHAQVIVLSKRIANLRRTRDLLLPRLLAGQVGSYTNC